MKKRDSMNKKLLCVSAICSLVSLFTACEALGPEHEPVTVSYEKAVARIQIESGIPGRTVRPDVALEDVSAWKLWGGKQEEQEAPLLEFVEATDVAIALEPGEWHFTVKGYKDGAHILSGTIPAQTISLEGTQTLVFEVEPVESGEGTVNLAINLPAGSGITEARVFKDGIELETSPIALAGDTIAFTETSDAGEYYYSFKLYNADAKLYGVVSEMVHVWANLESTKTYTLLQKDLNLTYTISYHVPVGTMPEGHYQIAVATTLATPLPRDGYYFKGWYERAEDAEEAAVSGNAVTKIPVGSTGDRDFYSRWVPEILSGYTLADALAVISGAKAGEAYTIALNANESFAPTTLSYGGEAVSITLVGEGAERTLNLSSKGSLFTLESGVTLKLGDNITLEGRSDNTASLVKVNDGGELEMNDGSKISGNSSTTNGGGVSVGSNGAFTMNGGEISGNTASGGSGRGGGVYINGGTFTLTDGTISNNHTTQSGSGATYGGGGVFVTGDGTFEMSGGVVSGNSSHYDGGGVMVYGATFRMTGGAVSGNSATYGGGVYIYNATFTMTGGAVSGNSAGTRGAGMYIKSGTFTKASGSVIYGSDADGALKNTATTSDGHAVYVETGVKKRDSTVEEGETLNSAQSGAAGGWVDRWTVNFNADAGTPSTQTARVNSGEYLGASMPSATRTGCTFGGWYTEQNGGGTRFTETTSVTGAITVYAFWLLPVLVTINLHPTLDDPALSTTTLLVSEEATFSAGSEYDSYQWYWDGEVISGEISPSYTLAPNAKQPGVYELSVVVAAAASPGEKLSARCRVTITAD
jgi:uncharacterized repeat protein (TIGR02543 family)